MNEHIAPVPLADEMWFSGCGYGVVDEAFFVLGDKRSTEVSSLCGVVL